MNKVALITGSSRGIGRAIAIKFAKEGYAVIINGSKESKQLDSLQAEILSLCVPCLKFVGDISEYPIVVTLFEEISRQFGKLDVLINNAGVSHVGLFTDMTPSEWTRLLQVNFVSVLNTCHLAVPMFVSKKCGRILNISSVWGNCGASCEAVYSATKGAINSFTKALAKELAPSNIPVNALACGVIDTEMNQCFTTKDREALCEEIPMGRMATTEEVADTVLRLCEGSEYLTGQVITFDGGWI